MKIHAALGNLVVRALSQSLPVPLMVRVASRVVPGYDVYERSGFPANIPMPRADAARQILSDFLKEELLFKLIEALIDLHVNGDMGREVPIQLLDRIIGEIEAQGYHFDPRERAFVESAHREKTMGWGTLQEGQVYEFALLRSDIVGNTRLLRMYDADLVRSAYTDMKGIFQKIVEKRNGRIWSWEGDGGVAAFYFLDKNIHATLCGMELIQELFLYNLLQTRLPEPLAVRLAVHAGPCRFLSKGKDIGSETIRRVELLESKYTRPDSLTVSGGVYTDLGIKLARFFRPVTGPEGGTLYRYAQEWQKR